MRFCFWLVIESFFLLLGQASFSQDLSKYPARFITEEDGLPSNEVYHVIEDHEGYLWFATDNGIAKYDGQNLLNFSTNDGLPENTVFRFYLQEDGVIVGECAENKYFEIIGDSIIPFAFNEKLSHTLTNDQKSHSYYRSPDGNHNFGSNGGLFVFSSEGLLLRQDTLDYNVGACFFSYIPEIDYVFTYTRSSPKGGTKFRLCQKQNSTIIYEYSAEYHASVSRSQYGVCINEGVYAVNFSNRVAILEKGKLLDELVFEYYPVGVFSIEGDLWVATKNGGVEVYSRKGDHFVKAQHLFDGYTVTSVHLNRNETYWITTTEGGVIEVDPRAPKMIFESEEDDNISRILANRENLFVGFDNGLFVANEGGYTHDFSQQITGILEFDSSFIVCNGGGKLHYLLNFQTKEFFEDWQLSEKSFVKSLNPLSEDILIASGYAQFYIIDLKNKKVDRIPRDVFNEKIMDWKLMDSLIYVSSAQEFAVIDPFTETIITRYNTESTVVSLFKTDSLIYGLSEDGKIYRYHANYSESADIPEDGRVFQYLDLVMANGIYYISTNHGVYAWRFDEQSQTPELLGFDKIENVIQMNVTDNSLYYATKKNVFKKNFDDFQLSIPEVKVPLIQVNEQIEVFSVDEQLSFDQNHIGFFFKSIALSKPVLDYRYRLIGHDKKFNYSTQESVVYSALNPGKYTFTYAATNDGFNYSDGQEITFTIQLPFWNTMWFYSFCGIILLLIIIGIYRFRLKQLTAKVQIEKTISVLKSQALTAQLNPHLIFNILNSIQGLVSEGQIEKSNVYISKFSRFMRLSLNLSKLSSVPVTEEIKIIEQYIELEKLRFESQIEFSICSSGELEEFLIPPLITQPLIENAIKHGVMGNKSEAYVKIEFTKEKETLIITVEDNGKGFITGISYGDGLRITEERLKVVSKKNELNILDSNNPTTVQIKITQ
ncbi:MAG: hypothetical protein ACI8ZM_005480 [Crocinitomix sp.]